MAKKLVSKTAKVLSETRKSKEKEAIAIAYEHIPRNPREQAHGSLYAVIEIEDSGGHSEEIAEEIIDILHREYYEDPDKDSLTSFENALAKINEGLAERSSEGQINWLGKLNAILGVLSDSTLHLTQAGKAEAFLYRGEHEMHITEDLSGDSVNPLRTFINVASGDLVEKDRVILVTPGIFYKISRNELKKFSTGNSPKIAVEHISKMISSENGASTPNAALLMEMVSPESFAVEPEPEMVSEAWVKEDKQPITEVSEKTLHGTAKAFDVLGKAAAGASAFVTAKVIPSLKNVGGKISKTVSGFKKESDAEQIIIESEEKIAPRVSEEIGNLEPDSESKILEPNSGPEFAGNEIRIKESKPSRLSLERFDFSFAKKAKDNFFGQGKKFKLPSGKYSIYYLIGGVVIIVALIGFLFYQNTIVSSQKAAENTYNTAMAKYNTAVEELGEGNRSAAITDLNEAEKLAKEAEKANYKKSETSKLLANISTEKDKALGVIKNTANVFADFGKGNLDGLFSDGTLFYGVKYEDGSVYAMDPKAKTVANIIEKPKIDGKIKFATLIKSRKTLVVYTEPKSLYEIDLVAKKATKQVVTGGLEDAVAMASYNTNIYLLSPSENQIYKHVSTAAGYGKKTAYVSSPTSDEFTSGLDLAVDSDVYALSKDGNVQKFTAGIKGDYEIKGLPQTLNANRIFAELNIAGQYFYNEKSITKIDKNQTFVADYVSDDVKSIKGIYVDDKSSTIFALSEGKIYSIGF